MIIVRKIAHAYDDDYTVGDTVTALCGERVRTTRPPKKPRPMCGECAQASFDLIGQANEVIDVLVDALRTIAETNNQARTKFQDLMDRYA